MYFLQTFLASQVLVLLASRFAWSLLLLPRALQTQFRCRPYARRNLRYAFHDALVDRVTQNVE